MSHLRHGRPHRMRGWGTVRARGARLPVRRYMRLIHYTLTVFDAADEQADLVIFEEILVGASVSHNHKKRQIIIKFNTDRFSVQLKTDREFDAWLRAFRDASRVAENFYKLVPSRQLGVGAFSTVYFGFDRDDGHHVAIKVVDKTNCSPSQLAYAETEARMMAYVRHPSIVQCRDIFDAPHTMHVVMQYMSGSTLEHRMLAHNPPHRFPEPIAATIMSHILDALAYLESQGICHRDVKPDNILLSSPPNESLWPTTARLSDFGLAAFVDSDTSLTDIVGTPNYVAPEVLTRDQTNHHRVGYGPPVDAWAAGILMFWMLSGANLPFDAPDSAAIFRSIRTATPALPISSPISPAAKSLLASLLHPNPATRLSCSAARTHLWLLQTPHTPLPVTVHAARLADHTLRKASLSPQTSLRAAVTAVRTISKLLSLVDQTALQRLRTDRMNRMQQSHLRAPLKKSLEEQMLRAPERAPAGADALGYNVGLIPSFVPKRRAKAGATDGTIGGQCGDAAARDRLSRESLESGISVERLPSEDRNSLGGSAAGRKHVAKAAWRINVRSYKDRGSI